MKFGASDCFILGRGLRKFLAASSTTMESLLLKELDFGLQKPTGPSSGVVASIVLIIIVFLHNSHTFQIVLLLRTTFLELFKNQYCCFKKNHKNPNLVKKLIIGKVLCYSLKCVQGFSFSHFIVELFGFL